MYVPIWLWPGADKGFQESYLASYLKASQRAISPPCHDFAWSYPAICQRIAMPRLCMVLPVHLPIPHVMAPPVCNWSPTGTIPVDRWTHTRQLMLVGDLLGPTGPDLGNTVPLFSCYTVFCLKDEALSSTWTDLQTIICEPILKGCIHWLT